MFANWNLLLTAAQADKVVKLDQPAKRVLRCSLEASSERIRFGVEPYGFGRRLKGLAESIAIAPMAAISWVTPRAVSGGYLSALHEALNSVGREFLRGRLRPHNWIDVPLLAACDEAGHLVPSLDDAPQMTWMNPVLSARSSHEGRLLPVEALGGLFRKNLGQRILAMAPAELADEPHEDNENTREPLTFAGGGRYTFVAAIMCSAANPELFTSWFRDDVEKFGLGSCLVDAVTDQFFPEVTYEDAELRRQVFDFYAAFQRVHEPHELSRWTRQLLEAGTGKPMLDPFVNTVLLGAITDQQVSIADFVTALDGSGMIRWSSSPFDSG